MSTHGMIMILFGAMPFMIGLMNFAVPLQLGVRDVAFPTPNSVSFRLTASGALLVNVSLVVGEFARTGWWPDHDPEDACAGHELPVHADVLMDRARLEPDHRRGLPDPDRDARDADAGPLVGAVMGGENPRDIAEGMLPKALLSTGMAAFPANADGLPFEMSHLYASGNIAADMYCNVAAESTGLVLAVRLSNATNDPGMKDMWSFLIARDTMHRQRWLAVIEELGGDDGTLPIPNSFPHSEEHRKFSHSFFSTSADGSPAPAGRWTQGPSLDGKGEYSVVQNQPMDEGPVLGPARPDSGAQSQQIG